MLQNAIERAILGALFVTFAAFVVGCGQSGSGNSAGGSVATSSSAGGASGSTSGSTGTGGIGGSGSGCASSCDDGLACTLDACTNGLCTHVIGPNAGPTACPTGQYCTLDQGCIASPACATKTDCVEAWKGDACKVYIECDPVTSTCTFKPLDKDTDGHPPQICGGDDCNDNDQDVFPGNVENCDGVDQDCDPTNEASGSCHYYQECLPQGSPGLYLCACKNEYSLCGQCGPIDFATDEDHCGTCDTKCPSGVTCEASICACPGGLTLCSNQCVDTATDETHCGNCTSACSMNATCTSGTCVCPANAPTVCNGACVDLLTSTTNCGMCGHVCFFPEECSQGQCKCLDPIECGILCGNTCGDGMFEPPCEECDDGNLNDGDGCSSTCKIE